jgi:hypothetical protein
MEKVSLDAVKSRTPIQAEGMFLKTAQHFGLPDREVATNWALCTNCCFQLPLTWQEKSLSGGNKLHDSRVMLVNLSVGRRSSRLTI